MNRDPYRLANASAKWRPQQEALTPASWQCGYCGNSVDEDQGWRAVTGGDHQAAIMVCPRCLRPTLFEGDLPPLPEPLPGHDVSRVPEPVDGIYQEARACVQAGAYRAAALTCRTALMYVAAQLNGGEKVKREFSGQCEMAL